MIPRMVPVAGTLLGALLLCACTSGAPASPTGGSAAASSSPSLPAETTSTAASPPPAVSGTAMPMPGSATPSSRVATSSDAASATSFEGVSVVDGSDLKQTPSLHIVPGADPQTLAVRDLIAGNGPPATAQDTVSVAYLGALYRTGAVFDSSYGRSSSELSLPNVIPGLAQGISGSSGIPAMKVGGRRLLIVPAALGYPGSTGAVPAHSPLVFVVDLVGVS